MRLSKRQLALATQLGKRLAAGDEYALEDIESVVRPYLVEAHGQEGQEISKFSSAWNFSNEKAS